MGTHLRLELPRAVALADNTAVAARSLAWTVPPGSTVRLHQLLAQEGYLPVDWEATGPDVARAPRAEVRAAVDPPSGNFSWRYPNVPPELRHLWQPTQANAITRGAVMMFQDEHHLAVDGFAGAQVWHALIADAIA